MIDLDDVRAAGRRLGGVVHRTPLVTARSLDERSGGRVLCKAENLQRAGSFKLRGAYNAMASLGEAERARGVVTYSSGNHAQAVALAARLLGTTATIVMPADAPPAKRAATIAYGGMIVTYDGRREDREDIARQLADERGWTVIPPYDDPRVMAGQGTAALELIEDAGPLDALVVPVGGGGLIAGCATAARGMLADVEVVGVEPADGDDTARSFAAGQRVSIPTPRTVADGLRATIPGELTFAVNRERVDRIVTVSDAAILAALTFVLNRLKLLVEPSGVVALAAVLSDAAGLGDRRVGVILSGGNVGSDDLSELLRRWE
ncbi:MAG: threonine/serine dehydratase [Actinomycetota bacterium]|nr:threonine/serine dehydratase [Actinomycetota bacterium]